MNRLLRPLLLLAVLTPANGHTYFSEDTEECQIIGDSDIYGLGIRLSYYFQWAAAIIAMFIAPEAANKARSGSNIITIAVFISSFYGAKNEQSLMVVEWYIVQYLVFWLMLWNLPASKPLLIESLGSIGILALNYTVVAVVPVWLYWTADDLGRKEGCDAFIFLYAPISSYNPKWITANKVLSIFGTCFSWVFLTFAIIALAAIFTTTEEELNEVDFEGMVSGLKYQHRWAWLMAVSGGFVIPLIEKTIRINHIEFPGTSLTNSGQLIPLLIGIFTIVSVLWEGLVNLRKRK